MKDHCEICAQYGIDTDEDLERVECGPVGTDVELDYVGTHTLCKDCAKQIRKSTERDGK